MVTILERYEIILGYAEYLSYGLMKELVHRIAEKEGKNLKEALKEMGMSTGTIYEPLGEDAKRKILEKAFNVLDPEEVLLEIFYDIRAIYGRIVRDILKVAKDETKKEILKNYNDIGIEKITNSFQSLTDKEFGNLIVEFQRNAKKSFEGEAFVTIGVDENGRISYIAIEPLDKELKEGIKNIKNE